MPANGITVKLSQISCPLCGKYSSVKTFDPESLPLTISTVEMKGMGRGLGFKSTNRQSVDFDSLIVRKIANRLLNLVLLMLSEEVISESEVFDELELNEYISKEDYDSLSDKLEEANNKIKRYKIRFGRMSRLIARSLKENFENWPWDEPFLEDGHDYDYLEDEDSKEIGFLEFGVDRLIDNYMASRAGREK